MTSQHQLPGSRVTPLATVEPSPKVQISFRPRTASSRPIPEVDRKAPEEVLQEPQALVEQEGVPFQQRANT